MRDTLLIPALVAAVLLPLNVLADDHPTEFSGGVSVMGGSNSALPWAHAGVSVPIAPQFAVEGVMNLAGGGFDGAHVTGLYQIDVKQRLAGASTRATQVFVTYGVAGMFDHWHQDAMRYQQAGGTYVDVPATSTTDATPPTLLTVGTGAQAVVGPHMAMRADLQYLQYGLVPAYGGLCGYRLAWQCPSGDSSSGGGIHHSVHRHARRADMKDQHLCGQRLLRRRTCMQTRKVTGLYGLCVLLRARQAPRRLRS